MHPFDVIAKKEAHELENNELFMAEQQCIDAINFAESAIKHNRERLLAIKQERERRQNNHSQ